jgi:hypothetical protein
MRRVAALAALVGLLAACSGGSTSHATIAPAARQQGALLAARACRMWTELMGQAVKEAPITPVLAAPLDARSALIAPVANQASGDDPMWANLATDVAGATDFASVALPDINSRIVDDCTKVPDDAKQTVAGQPDPFSTSTTVP